MATRVRWASALASGLVLSAMIVAGCGSSDQSLFGDGNETGSNGGPGSNGPFTGDPNGPGGSKPCEGLACKQEACANGATTTLTGTVYDPSGSVALYNAVVYVPNAPVEPFKAGVSCDNCGTALSGKPISTAITDAKGQFALKNVPVGVDVPLVIQIGRWRRQITVPAANVEKCGTKSLDAAMTRLPRTRTEGDIPKIAITTGNADSLECFVRKLGVDPAEFTNPTDSGRINLYQGLRANQDGAKINAQTPAASTLWDNLDELKKYDIVILSCEGAENNDTKDASHGHPNARGNLNAYLEAGGRVFASHFHYSWYKLGAGKLPQTATWAATATADDRDVTVDTSFAKGKAFSEWLDFNKATKAPDTVAMKELRANVTSVPADVSRRWLYVKDPSQDVTKFYTFNAPIGVAPEQQCGRGVYTDIHVSAGDIAEISNTTHHPSAPAGVNGIPDFPNNCISQGFTEQEKALLFLLFDLSACVQDDSKPPSAPAIK
jgi:hypothetical protein